MIDTNKYLEKVARIIAQKTELEPGVYWNHSTKSVVPGRNVVSEHMERKDRNSRLLTGAVAGSIYGVPLGVIGGVALHKKHFTEEGVFYNMNKHLRDIDDWVAKNPHPSDLPSPTTEDMNKWKHEYHSILDPSKYTSAETKFPKINKFLNRIGGARKVLPIAGGVLGFGVLGAAGYALGGMLPEDKKLARNEFQEKLENKHEARINQIEGWE